jgi:hypothetical protein
MPNDQQSDAPTNLPISAHIAAPEFCHSLTPVPIPVVAVDEETLKAETRGNNKGRKKGRHEAGLFSVETNPGQ